MTYFEYKDGRFYYEGLKIVGTQQEIVESLNEIYGQTIIGFQKRISHRDSETASLREQLAAAQAGLAAAHKAIEPYIAGGSEYTGTSGLIRAISSVGERSKNTGAKLRQTIIERNNLQAEADRAKAAISDSEAVKIERELAEATQENMRLQAENAQLKAAANGKSAMENAFRRLITDIAYVDVFKNTLAQSRAKYLLSAYPDHASETAGEGE